MLQDQVIPIGFGQGVETKSDPKTVVPGKYIRLENGVFTKPGQIAKRNGYTALGTSISDGTTLTSAQMTHGYNNELLSLNNGVLLSYSSNQDAWTPKGNYTSVELERSLVGYTSADIGASGIASVAILNNYALYGWSDPTGQAYAQVIDISTGEILKTTTLFVNGSAATLDVRCVLLGGATLAVVYSKNANYGAKTVSFPGAGVVSFSVETVITVNFLSAFDIVPTATGGAFVYINNTGITVATLSTALAVASVSFVATSAQNTAISTTSNNNIWIYWNETTNDGMLNLTASTIYYAIYSSVLAAVLGKSNIVTLGTPYYVSNMIAKADSATQQTLYYGLFTTNNNGSKHMLEYSNYATVNSAAGVGTPTLFANGVIPYSHPFTVGSKIYAVFFYRRSDITVIMGGVLGAPIQPTLFVVELTNLTSPPYVVARFAAGVASSFNGLSQTTIYQGNVAPFSATKFYFACGVEVQGFASPNTFIGGLLGTFAYSFDFAGSTINSPKNAGNVAMLNGAAMQMYDGFSCTEFGFNLFPEITNLAGHALGGGMGDGTYSYLAIFSWIDAQGNLHQSAPSVASNITLSAGGGAQSVTVTVTTNFLSQKNVAYVEIYRTINAGSIYYLVTNPVIVSSANATLGAITTFVDGTTDGNLILGNQAYTYPASSVLENSTPPPSMAMVAHNNRLWFVDSENPNTIWYTKSSQNLVGLSPSAFLTEQIDHKLGNIVALAEMDEKLIIGKTNGIFAQSGDGADDTGNGSSLSFPQAIPSDVGMTVLKSVVQTPRGVLFKSANGIYLLDRSLNVSYIGAEVEAYNSQVITGANLVPTKSQIRFLCSSGLTLVYDYLFNQWSTFTNHTGVSSSTWNSLYVYATTAGSVFKESIGSYLDNATGYSLLAQTSWLALASIQGFQRVRRLIMLGDFVNGASASHNLSISAAYDFSTTFQTAVTYAFGAISSSGVFQYRERLPIQKCDALSLLIQETTTGSSLEYIDLTNISFEIGVKKGVNKLRGQQSVG